MEFVQQRRTTTLFGAVLTTLRLIHVLTVHDLRKNDSSPIWGLIMAMVKSLVMLAGFAIIFLAMGVRTAPLRGDMILFLLSGIFVYMVHIAAIAAVGGGRSLNPLTQHGPINSAILICASALSVLYTQTASLFIVLLVYYCAVDGFTIVDPVAAYGLFLLAWLSGCGIGLIFMSLTPWWPKGIPIVQQTYTRINMIASGKMMVANGLPNIILPMFMWNPLFHNIDQLRGYVFQNYNPHKTSITYPVVVTLVLILVGLMGEFVTRKHASVSWSKGK